MSGYANKSTLAQALAYEQTALRQKETASPLVLHDRAHGLFRRMMDADAAVINDHKGYFPWLAMMHHWSQYKKSKKYSARIGRIGFYEEQTFYELSQSESITETLDGALFTSEVTVSRETIRVRRQNTLVSVPFARFSPVRIPRIGVWVMVLFNVMNPRGPVEFVQNRYEITHEEMRTMWSTHDRTALVPFQLSTEARSFELRSFGIDVPYVMVRMSPTGGLWRDDWITASGAVLQLQLSESGYSQYAASELGETVHSALIGDPSESTAPGADPSTDDAVKTALEEVARTHRVSQMHGYYTSNSGQQQIGTPGRENAVGSHALAVLALDIAVRQIIAERLPDIIAELDKLNPQWRQAADVDSVAAYQAKLGVEALFGAVAPSGRKSPVLAELKRIFGDKGLPSLKEFLDGIGSGLPHAAPGNEDLAARLEAVLSAKIDNDASRGVLITEHYMASVLSRVMHPSWHSGKSPLTLSVLISAMPDNLVSVASAVLRNDLDMTTASLKHAGVSNDPRVECKRTAPGVFVLAPLENYERAARRLISRAVPALEATGVKNAAEVDKVLKLVRNNPNATVPAESLQFCGLSPTARVAFVQLDSLSADDQKRRIRFDATKMYRIVCVRDTLLDGSLFVMLLDRASGQSLVLKFAMHAMDHRDAFVRDVVAVLGKRASAAAAGPAVVGELERLVAQTLAIDAYNAEQQQQYKAPAAPTVPAADTAALLRNWARFQFVPTGGSMDNNTLRIKQVTPEQVQLAFKNHEHTEQDQTVISAAVSDNGIGSGRTAIRAAEIPLVLNTERHVARVMSVGDHLYVNRDALAVINALQSKNLTAAAARQSQTSASVQKTDVLAHDPYALGNAMVLVTPSTPDAPTNERDRLIAQNSPLVLNHVGAPNVLGPVLPQSQRTDLSVYNSGPLAVSDEWRSPFAC